MRISPARLPDEDSFSEDTKAFLALMRSIPEVPKEYDPNGWFRRICDHLKRSPRERMEPNWTETQPVGSWSPKRESGGGA